MGEGEFGESTFNMSLPTLVRFDNLLKIRHELAYMEFYKGNPLYYSNLKVLINIYIETRPHLKPDEKITGDAYRSIFTMKFNGKKLIEEDGEVTIIDNAVPTIMMEWTDWLMEKLFEKKLLIAVGEDPGDVIE